MTAPRVLAASVMAWPNERDALCRRHRSTACGAHTTIDTMESTPLRRYQWQAGNRGEQGAKADAKEREVELQQAQAADRAALEFRLERAYLSAPGATPADWSGAKRK